MSPAEVQVNDHSVVNWTGQVLTENADLRSTGNRSIHRLDLRDLRMRCERTKIARRIDITDVL